MPPLNMQYEQYAKTKRPLMKSISTERPSRDEYEAFIDFSEVNFAKSGSSLPQIPHILISKRILNASELCTHIEKIYKRKFKLFLQLSMEPEKLVSFSLTNFVIQKHRVVFLSSFLEKEEDVFFAIKNNASYAKA